MQMSSYMSRVLWSFTWSIGSAKALLGLIFRVLAKTSRSKVQYLPRYLYVTACNYMYVSIWWSLYSNKNYYTQALSKTLTQLPCRFRSFKICDVCRFQASVFRLLHKYPRQFVSSEKCNLLWSPVNLDRFK